MGEREKVRLFVPREFYWLFAHEGRGKTEGTIIRSPRVLLVVLTRRKGKKAAIVKHVKIAKVTTQKKKRKTVERDRSTPKVDLPTV